MHYNNIKRLCDIVRDLESEDLVEKLRIQHGEYTFPTPVPVPLCVRKQDPVIVKIKSVSIVNFGENPQDMLIRFVAAGSGNTEITFLNIDCVIPAGEMGRLFDLIPNTWLDPVTVKFGYADFAQLRFADTGELVPDKHKDFRPTVKADAVKRTVTANHGGVGILSGREADEAVFRARKILDEGGTMAQAADFLYQSTNIDLPF